MSVGSRQLVTVMGENGTGKTTLIEALLGNTKPISGTIRFWGNPYSPQTREKLNQQIGWVISMKEHYPPGLRVADFFKTLRPTYKTWNKNLEDELLQKFELDPYKLLTHLSLGENSKVKLIKALAFHPKLLILDELTANLSENSKKVIVDTLIDLFSKQDMAVFYVTHSKDEAIRLSDQIFLIENLKLKERKV